MESVEDKLIAQFLLGELSEDKRVPLEELMFKDDGFYERVLAIQEELADDYVQGRVSARQRTQFENHFLRSPLRRERIAFAATLTRAMAGQAPVAPVEASGSHWWNAFLAFRLAPSSRVMLAAWVAVLVLAVGSAFLYVDNRRLSGRIEQARGEREALIGRSRSNEVEAERKSQTLEEEIAALRSRGGEMEAAIHQKEQELATLKRAAQPNRPAPSIGEIATFILSPGLTRGTDEPEKILISGTSRTIQLQLALEKPESYRGYVAEIRTARGNLVLSRSLPAAQQTSFGQAVSLTAPASQLPIGEYEIALKGASEGKLEAVGYYYFIALRR